MRKLILSILLATTAAVPATAQPADSDDVRAERAERRAQQAERIQRSQIREQRIERIRQDRPVVHDDSDDGGDRAAARAERRRAEIAERRAEVRERIREQSDEAMPARPNLNERGRPTLEQRRQSHDGVAEWRRDERPQVNPRDIEHRFTRVRPPAGARPDRPAPPPETASRRDRHPEWHRDWRRDHRYDWRRWRERNRSHFHVGFYYDPFGWHYRRYGIGWRLWPSYYSNRYWLNDPWSYRLPYAPWPYKWVRYWDDAILVNTRTGEVVDVIYDFFW